MFFSQLDFRTPPGFDRTRNAEIGNKDIKFKHLEEAFTSEHWLVRIYKVKNLDNREPLDHKLRSVVPKQKYTSKKVAGVMVFLFRFNLFDVLQNIVSYTVWRSDRFVLYLKGKYT